MGSGPAGAPRRSPGWPWAFFVLAVAWSTLIRIPLVVNAPRHLDSDLAVDGLDSLGTRHSGHWRLAFARDAVHRRRPCLALAPASPDLGREPANPGQRRRDRVALSHAGDLSARLAGLRASRRRGRLVPAGVRLDGGRPGPRGVITGGHLVAAGLSARRGVCALPWSAGIVAGARWGRPLALALWCGLGLALDSMFALTLVGVVVSRLILWGESHRPPAAQRSPARGRSALAFSAGIAPRYVA